MLDLDPLLLTFILIMMNFSFIKKSQSQVKETVICALALHQAQAYP